ncbi:DUF5641 domain-containing protein [Aphis craccivora]|uniref:DUF5641 domain-containing protein n=1 Tax=Aphis craccivora TaxID=307492 RepID=A0A6G0ZN62_APHCR|nr:DUF5641 domain-containing protein [Aphis craccivora]
MNNDHCKGESHRKLKTFEFERHIYVGIIGMYGNIKSSPLNFPFEIVASIMLFVNFFTESLVSLKYLSGLIFRSRMTGTPNFNVTCGGIPGKSSEFSWIFHYLITSS